MSSNPESIVTCLDTSKKMKEAGWDKETVFIWVDEGDNNIEWHIEPWNMFLEEGVLLKETPYYHYAPTSSEIELPALDENSIVKTIATNEYVCEDNSDLLFYEKSEVEAKAKMWLYLKEKGLI